MRKLTTLFVALMLSVIAFAAEPQTVYCTITSYPTGSLDGREWVKISYGQEDDSRNWLVDENGKKKIILNDYSGGEPFVEVWLESSGGVA
jgi:hypothetical protein